MTFAHLIKFLQIQGLVGVNSFRFIRLGVNEPLNEASELLLGFADHHVGSPDDQLRATRLFTGNRCSWLSGISLEIENKTLV